MWIVVIESRRLRLPDIETTVSLAGPPDGPAVILLHGFPDDRHGWNRQMLPLADAGFRVIALDQRGCGEAAAGTSLRSYTVSRLVDDVEATLGALGIERAHLVGHDWGGIVGWTAAIEHRSWLERLVIVNVPHPAVFARFVRTHPSQLLKSWYMLFFQLPAIPEMLLGAGRAAPLTRALTASALPAAFTREELERYRSVWSTPGKIKGMLDWYRAVRLGPVPRGRVEAPTLIVWGERDIALDRRLAALSAERCDDVTLATLEAAGHWPHRESPTEVNGLLIEHLRP